MVIIIGSVIIYKNKGGTISGTIKDCSTGQNVSQASIRSRQIGWGFRPNLVWDKAYDLYTTSDQNGHFSIKVPLRKPTELWIVKENYIDASEWREINKEANIRILSGDPKSFQKPPGYIVYTTNCIVN